MNHTALTLLAVPLVLAAAFAQTTPSTPAKPATTPEPTTKPMTPSEPTKPTAPTTPAFKATTPAPHEGTEKLHNAFNAIAKEGKAKVVFLGDSITEHWAYAGKPVWEKHFAGCANFGIGGDRTEHILWRIDHGNFDNLKPNLIVLLIGTNNTGHRKDPAAETAAGVRAILDRLRTKCPDATILLMAVFPRGETATDPYRAINTQLNALLAPMADGSKIIYKDIGSKFLDDKGNAKKDLMPDYLHLSEAGYTIWAEAIAEDVKKAMGEEKK
jgi:N-acetylglucosamine-6-sulfatase